MSGIRDRRVSAIEGFLIYTAIGSYIPDLSERPLYRGCPQFRGVHLEGFHCIETRCVPGLKMAVWENSHDFHMGG